MSLKSVAIAATLFTVPAIGTAVGFHQAAQKANELKMESEQWRTESQQWKAQSDQWRSQVGELGHNLESAADKLDPLALKTIFRKTESLQAMLDEARAQLQAAKAPQTGPFSISDGNLVLVMIQARGDFTVQGFCDEQSTAYQQISRHPDFSAVAYQQGLLATTKGIVSRDGNHKFRVQITQTASEKKSGNWRAYVALYQLQNGDTDLKDSKMQYHWEYTADMNPPPTTLNTKDGTFEFPFVIKGFPESGSSTKPSR